MSSVSMPPPPSPLTHRRTRLNNNANSADPSSCVPRKTQLSKGATFHSSSSTSDIDPVLSIQYLSRRSPTCSHASLSTLLSEKRGLAAQTIADFEETFSGARGLNQSSRRRSNETFNQQLKAARPILPTDEGLGSSVSSPSEKGISKSLAQVELDSALGDSVDGSVQEDGGVSVQLTSEKDSSVAANLIQETNNQDNTSTIQTRQQGRNLRQRPARAQSASTPAPAHPALSRFARKKISELLFNPLLKEQRYEAFHPIVSQLSKVNKNLRCLRDLERSLIFQPLTRTLSVSPRLYQSFGEFTIQLVIDTYGQLSETEQRRITDRPYSNGYFLDLVQQVGQLASHINNSSKAKENGEEVEEEEEIFSIEDEVTLEGGLASSGDFAELVRWKNGKGTSLRTGLPYEPMAGLKRQHSSGAMTAEEIERSMARRKKGYIPEIVEMKCSDPECDKIFTRKCDLAKHEKTHSRPFKCGHRTCKYFELGLPTEKELQRHVNDKHAADPRLYPCHFCEFKTKRESNCKQHMEKKHNWEYKRAKGKDKDTGSTPSHTPHTINMDYTPSVIMPSPSQATLNWDDHNSVSGSVTEAGQNTARFTPMDDPMNSFDTYNPNFQTMPIFPRQPAQGTHYVSPTNQFGYEINTQNFNQNNGLISPESANLRMTPVTPAYSTFTPQGQSPFTESLNYTGGAVNNVMHHNGLPTPESAIYASHSRHPSVSCEQVPVIGSLVNHHLTGESEIQLPEGDFALDLNAFTNLEAANQTLFDSRDMSSQQWDPSLFENIENIETYEHYENYPTNESFEDMVDFNAY